MNEEKQKYYRANREKILQQQREYYFKNKAKRQQYSREYYLKNKNHFKEDVQQVVNQFSSSFDIIFQSLKNELKLKGIEITEQKQLKKIEHIVIDSVATAMKNNFKLINIINNE